MDKTITLSLTPFFDEMVNNVRVDTKHRKVIGIAKPIILDPSEPIFASGISNLINHGKLTTATDNPIWDFQPLPMDVFQKSHAI